MTPITQHVSKLPLSYREVQPSDSDMACLIMYDIRKPQQISKPVVKQFYGHKQLALIKPISA